MDTITHLRLIARLLCVLFCTSCVRFSLYLFSFLFLIVRMVEDDKWKKGNTDHHWECREVIGVGRRDESLVLIVSKWSNRQLRFQLNTGIFNLFIIDAELENAISIWKLEFGTFIGLGSLPKCNDSFSEKLPIVKIGSYIYGLVRLKPFLKIPLLLSIVRRTNGSSLW